MCENITTQAAKFSLFNFLHKFVYYTIESSSKTSPDSFDALII